MTPFRIPRAARWLIGLGLPRTLRDPVLGDLEEGYRRRVARDGRGPARRWLWRETLAAWRALGRLSDEPTTLTIPRSPMDGVGTDVRFALRVLFRRPGFAALAVATLGLGIGASTTIFSVVKPVLLESLPYPGGDRLVLLWQRDVEGDSGNLGYATFEDLRAQSRAVVAMAAIGSWQPTLLGTGESVRLAGQRVTRDYFRVLGVDPALGRHFLPEEDRGHAPRVVLLSHRLWRDRFGADPGIVGRTIALGSEAATVVGVLPADFENVLDPSAEIWSPLRYDVSLAWACRTCRHLRVVGRLAPDATVASAAAELSTHLARVAAVNPGQYPSTTMLVEPVKSNVTKRSRASLLLLVGAVGLVLTLACVNVANLLLGKAAERRREYGVRMALGSGRGRLVRQTLIESGLLGIAGAVVGVAIAFAASGVIRAVLRTTLPRADAIGVDWSVLGFASVVGIVAGITFGILPALASLESARDGLRLGGRATARHPARRGLIVAEVGLAVALVAGAGLLLKSMSRLLAVDPGLRAEGLITADIQLAGPQFDTDSAAWRYWNAVRDAVEAVPGVTSAALVSQLPLGGNVDTYGVRFPARPLANPALAPSSDRYAVTPGYFETTGIPLREGRLLTPADRAGAAPVVVVNETLARAEFAGRSPIGEVLTIGDPAGPHRTIVGVVGDVRHHGLDRPGTQQVYFPTEQWGWAESQMLLVARTATDPAALAEPIRSAIRRLDRDPTIQSVRPMAAVIDGSVAARRLVLRIFQAFAALALTLAAIGIYGVMASGVTERVREFGVRAALGASRGELTRGVLAESIRLAGLGTVLGLGLAVVLAPALGRFLFETPPVDPPVYLATAAALGLIAVLATWLPARRAAGSDPAEALRAE